MDLTTTWLGKTLPSPLVAGASPLSDDLDSVRALADAGAGAVVMQSLFEEELREDQKAMDLRTTESAESFPEALTFFPELPDYGLGPDRYLRHLEALKKAVDIPVIGSLNGVTVGGWVHYAKRMVDAGADALELNVYYVAMDLEEPSSHVEARYIDVLDAVRKEVDVPLAMKLSPYFSSPVNMAKRLVDAGANGVVLFNRFYQPDIDVERLEAEPTLHLSDSTELLLRLRWLAAMYERVPCELAATGGVHTTRDVVKALMAGASTVQLASVLLRHGPRRLRKLREELEAWLEEHEYESVRQMIGSMSMERSPDPSAYARANYMRIIRSWHP